MKAESIAALCARLAKLPAAVTSDVLGEMGLRDQVLASAIGLVGNGAVVAGPALCVRGEKSAAALKTAFEMDRKVNPGAVVVLATGGYSESAVIGGNIGLSFKLHGAIAVITDGGARDKDEFAEIGLPLFCAYITPLAPKGRWSYVTVDEPVTLPGISGRKVSIRPGDILHGDADGVVVVPQEHIASVVPDGEEVERIENKIKHELRRGDDREAVYGRNPRFAHIRKVSPTP